MTAAGSASKLRVVIVGGGVAALEAACALAEIAPETTTRTLIAPNQDFVYRPMTVREPFAHPPARRYPLARIAADAKAELLAGEVADVDTEAQIVSTRAGDAIHYDALVLALGAAAHPRFEHAITVDDRRMDETLHGLIQDVEGGYTRSIAFVAAGRAAWPLPLYELALMTAGRAYEGNLQLRATLVTPEEAPLASFGDAASAAVAQLLEQAGVETLLSAHAEVPRQGEVLVNPGDRRLHVDRVVALPELSGPPLHGVPLGEHGFIAVTPFGQVPGAGPVYAAGDATQFPVKHGGLAAHQAGVVATSVAALAGEDVTPERFEPTIYGVLLTAGKPLYLKARLADGRGYDSEVTDSATWWPPTKIVAPYLAPYLEGLDAETA